MLSSTWRLNQYAWRLALEPQTLALHLREPDRVVLNVRASARAWVPGGLPLGVGTVLGFQPWRVHRDDGAGLSNSYRCWDMTSAGLPSTS